MVNESKKRDLRMWKKWKESGATAKHPEAYRKEQMADLKIDPPEPLYRNWMIHFRSEGRSQEWRDAYAWTIMDLAEKRNWQPFFQSGSQTDFQSWQMIELWGCREPETLESFLAEVHDEVQKRYKNLFEQ